MLSEEEPFGGDKTSYSSFVVELTEAARSSDETLEAPFVNFSSDFTCSGRLSLGCELRGSSCRDFGFSIEFCPTLASTSSAQLLRDAVTSARIFVAGEVVPAAALLEEVCGVAIEDWPLAA